MPQCSLSKFLFFRSEATAGKNEAITGEKSGYESFFSQCKKSFLKKEINDGISKEGQKRSGGWTFSETARYKKPSKSISVHVSKRTDSNVLRYASSVALVRRFPFRKSSVRNISASKAVSTGSVRLENELYSASK